MSAPMIEAGNGGSTITISSAAGIKAVPGCVPYCASKSGVVGLTNSLAVELGEFGIRVNSVHPYGTDSRWATTCRCTRCSRTIPTTSTVSRRARCRPIPLADPDLISDIVVWLARDASSLVTAAQIPADKGYLEI